MARAGAPSGTGAGRRGRSAGRRASARPGTRTRPRPRTRTGRAFRLLWWVSPVLVAVVTILGSARVAPPASATGAQEPPGSTTTTIPTVRPSTPGGDPLDPDDLNDPEQPSDAERELLAPGAVENPCQPSDGSPSTVGESSVVPDDCWGRFPSSHYDIGCDEGAWNHITRKVYCTFTDLAFQGARSATATTLWLVEWAYAFGVYERLGGPAIAVAETYESNLIGPLGLVDLAWFYAVVWTGINILRGRLALAGGEFLASVIMAGLAGMLLANPSGYLHGAFDTMGMVSGALLSTGTGQPPPDDALDADAVLAPLQAQLHDAFVGDPYDHLDWGGSDMPAECAATRDRILSLGPWGNDDAPRAAMDAAGCEAQAEFNADPNGSRLFGSVLTMTAALVMVVLVGLVSLTIVVAQIVAVVLFAVAPFAALGAILTGNARKLALGWIAAMIRVILVVVGMSFVLSLLLLTIEALLSAGADATLVERFALVNIVVIAMFAARRRVLHAGADLAANIGGRLSPQAAQAEKSWLAAGTVAGVSGFALAGGLDSSPGRVRTMAQGAASTRVGQRRSFNTSVLAEQRGLRPVARENVAYNVDPKTGEITRGAPSVAISGGQPMTRRAAAARAKLERRSQAQLARTARQMGIRAPTPGRRAAGTIGERLRRRGGGGGGGGSGGGA